jgi:transcriptional regulator with XRE-family HTH domain
VDYKVGDRIRELRKALGLTQEEFASRLHISKGFLSNLEKGVRRPSDQLLRLIAYEFSSSENWLKTGEGTMFVSPEETANDLVTRLGYQAFIDALMAAATKYGFVVSESPAQYSADPELDRMIGVLRAIWESGDERLKAWASVQFDRAFPPDIQEQVAQVAQKNKKAPRRSSTG